MFSYNLAVFKRNPIYLNSSRFFSHSGFLSLQEFKILIGNIIIISGVKYYYLLLNVLLGATWWRRANKMGLALRAGSEGFYLYYCGSLLVVMRVCWCVCVSAEVQLSVVTPPWLDEVRLRYYKKGKHWSVRESPPNTAIHALRRCKHTLWGTRVAQHHTRPDGMLCLQEGLSEVKVTLVTRQKLNW